MTTLALVLLSMVLAAPGSQSATEERDRALEDAVWASLKAEKVDDQVAEVIAEDGVVTLRGKPDNAYMKMKAVEAALSVEGVEAVESDLEVATAESPDDLAKDLVNKVLTYPHYTVFDDVGFQLQDEGVVVVTGYVTMGFKKDELESRLGKVKGVTELKSVLEVLPSSSSDDELRRRLFDGIYGNQLFAQYANRTHPPIHIIVDGPNVMLTGAVRNKIEKIQAESIARSTFGVINVDNRLRVAN